jgi:valyl-tRNA synthetase
LELIDRYGADGVRMGMMLSAPAGNDILFDEVLCEQGRNFNNKIWNAFRLIKGWQVDERVKTPDVSRLAVRWFEPILNKTAAEIADLLAKYRLSEALMVVYKLFWDEFSSWYLELIKPAYGLAIDGATYQATLSFFDKLLKLLHPFMPFITEELWQQMYERKEGESIMVSLLAPNTEVDEPFINQFETVKEIISNVRTIRLQKNIAIKEVLELQVIGHHLVETFNAVIIKMCNLSAVVVTDTKAEGTSVFMVGTTEFAVPLGNLIDIEAEIARMEAELTHKEGFLQGILKKLNNERFVNNAPPAVLEMERKKQADAESIIKSLREGIELLRKSHETD